MTFLHFSSFASVQRFSKKQTVEGTTNAEGEGRSYTLFGQNTKINKLYFNCLPLKKKKWHGPLSHLCREGKTLVGRPLKEKLLLCVSSLIELRNIYYVFFQAVKLMGWEAKLFTFVPKF